MGDLGENYNTIINDIEFTIINELTKERVNEIKNEIGEITNEIGEITNVILGTGVTSIGDHAFENCHALTSVTIPSSVTSIGAYAFLGCHALTSVIIPNSVTSIGEDAFAESGLKFANVNRYLTAIADFGTSQNFFGKHSVTVFGPDADFTSDNFANLDLTGVNLTGVNLTDVNLFEVDLTGVNLTNANLTNAILQDVNLTNANLKGVNLENVNLLGFDLTDVDLTGANLTNANLKGADLSNANLTNAILTGVKSTIIEGTPLVLPPGYIINNGYLIPSMEELIHYVEFISDGDNDSNSTNFLTMGKKIEVKIHFKEDVNFLDFSESDIIVQLNSG